MSTKKLLAVFLTLAMVIVSMGGASYAKAASATSTYVEIQDDAKKEIELIPGETTKVVIPVKATTTYIYNPKIEISADANAPFTFTDPTLTTALLPLGAFAIDTNGLTFINFEVKTKENAKIGKYPIKINISFIPPVIDESGIDTLEQSLDVTCKISKEKAPAQLAISNMKYNEDSAAIGNTFDVSFDVTNVGEIAALNSYIEMGYGETGIIADYSVLKVKVGDLKSGEKKNVKLSMKILPTATEGLKNLTANFSFKDTEGAEYKSASNLYVTVKKTSIAASEDAKLVVNSSDVNNEIGAGGSYDLKGVIKNVGLRKASNIVVSIVEGTGVTTGIIPNFDSQTLAVSDINANKSAEFSLPLMVTESANAGLTQITVQVSYTDSEGNTKTTVAPFYITVTKPQATTENSDIVISNVSQSPEAPLVGQRVTLTFTVENRGNKAATNVSVGGEGLATSGFEPFTAQAYKEVGTIEANSKKTVSLDFKVGSNVSEGLNTLTLGCKFQDGSGNKQAVTSDVYVLNVINDSNSKPKIIVSNFSKDSEELKAGSTFNFTYTLKNTHTSKAAKNIKVTISQADNVFSATQGTNTFYIDRIDAGEEVESSIELKVKSDVTTAAYELEIKVEYEYDGMSKVDLEAGGVTESNKLKLQAVENLRPSIQNISLGYGDTPQVNMSTVMTFDFVNMGKSPLNNVRFSLEGSIVLETGASYYFGSMSPGSPEYVELSVMPTEAGICSGALVMTFEDSNGDEVVRREEFSDIFVAEQMSYEDMGDWGGMDPSVPSMSDETETDTNKDIMPVWVFILIQVAILAIVIPVVRVIVIKHHKKKLRDQEDNL